MNNNLFDGFRITHAEIASGGSAVVHDALSSDGERVALKVLDRKVLEEKFYNLFKKQKPNLSSSELDKKTKEAYELNINRFKAEYQALVGFSHPHVAKVYKIGFFEGQFYIAYEFVDGKPLAEYLLGKEPADMLPLFVQGLEGLDYIHRNGLIHLDIKSDNILVQEVDGKPQVKIIDFGLAIAPEEYGGSFVGTVDTVAPEVALGWKDRVDARADLFSFGIEMYRCLTWGGSPYARTHSDDRELIRRFIKEEAELTPRLPSYTHSHKKGFIPEYLDTIVMRLIAHRPEDRFYGNARAVINALLTHAPDLFGEDVAEKSAYLIPEGNRHIGCDDEIKSVADAINALAEGKQPTPGIFWVRGEQGMGKTHFLQKIKEAAERHVEKISIVSVATQGNPKLSLQSGETNEAISNFDEPTIDTLADVKPTIVLVDDVEDENIIAPYIRLLEQPNPSPLLLCFTCNESFSLSPGGRGQGEGDLAFHKIDLHPFTKDRLAEYVGSTPALKGKELPPKWVETLYSRTEGIPARVHEYLTQLDNHSFLFGLDGEIILSSVTPIEFVGSLSFRSGKLMTTQQRFLSVYMSLNPFEREVVHLLAVWNWQSLLPLPTIDDLSKLIPNSWLPQTLNALEQQGILTCHYCGNGEAPPAGRQESCFSFTNDLMPGFIGERIYEEEQRALHDKIADHLDSKSDIAAIHRAYGCETRSWKVIRDALVAAKQYAFKEGRLGVGVIVLQRLLELIAAYPNPRVPGDDSHSGLPPVKRFTGHQLIIYVMMKLIDVYYHQGKFQEAQAIYERAADKVALLSETRRTYSIMLSLCIIPVFTAMKEYERAEAVIADAKQLHDDKTNVPTWPALLNYEARMYYDRRNEDPEYLSKAKMLYEQSEVFEGSLPECSRERITNNDLGTLLFSMGEYEKAVSELNRKYQRDSKLGHAYNAARTAFMISESHRMQRKYGEAEKYAKQALDHVNEGSRMLPYVHEMRARLFHDMDKIEEAIKEDRRSLAASCFIGDNAERASLSERLWLHMGHCYKELEKWDEAIAHFEAVESRHCNEQLLMSASEGAGEVYFHKGDFDRASRYFDKTDELLTRLPQDAVAISHKFRIAKLQMEMHLKRGECGKALAFLRVLKATIDDDEKREQEYLEMERRISRTPAE